VRQGKEKEKEEKEEEEDNAETLSTQRNAEKKVRGIASDGGC
jgi:hypothetical protein